MWKKIINNQNDTMEDVPACDFCHSNIYETFKIKPTIEWEQVRNFYRSKNKINDPFLRIPETFTLVKCKKCGLVYVNPRLKGKIVNRFYNEYLSGKFSDILPVYNSSFREEIFTEYIKLIEDETKNLPLKSLLDIGCATGSLLKIAKNKNWEVYGIEISPVAVKKAREFGKIYCGDMILQLKKIRQKFSVITFIDSLEHISSPKAVLTLAHEKLIDNGNIFVEVPNVESGLDEMSRHFYLFSKSSIYNLLESIGFSEIRFVDFETSKYNSEDIEYKDRFIRVIAQKKKKKNKDVIS